MIQMVETTKERYDNAVVELKLRHSGIRVIQKVSYMGQIKQVQTFFKTKDSLHLFSLGQYNLTQGAHSQFFIYKDVEMGVTTVHKGLNNTEVPV